MEVPNANPSSPTGDNVGPFRMGAEGQARLRARPAADAVKAGNDLVMTTAGVLTDGPSRRAHRLLDESLIRRGCPRASLRSKFRLGLFEDLASADDKRNQRPSSAPEDHRRVNVLELRLAMGRCPAAHRRRTAVRSRTAEAIPGSRDATASARKLIAVVGPTPTTSSNQLGDWAGKLRTKSAGCPTSSSRHDHHHVLDGFRALSQRTRTDARLPTPRCQRHDLEPDPRVSSTTPTAAAPEDR